MTRCAIYARYSSDRQNERSIEDQIAVCRRYADTQGWVVVSEFQDAALSGSAMGNRPGILTAVSAAEDGKFEVLLAEHADRISRDLEHHAHVFNRLDTAGVRIFTVASGEETDIHVAVNGLMSQQYIKNLSAKTKRGMRSNAEKGLATGSRLYGYRSSEGGHTTIIPEEAEVIRRIFADYISGETARNIASSLNEEGILGPRGGPWNQSTITGSRQRGNGILNTELYVGVKVWNRMIVKKDRSSGKRRSICIPPEKWQKTLVPHLKIVDQETWDKVRFRKDRATAEPNSIQRRPGIFSGLLKCGVCGSTYTVYTTGKLVCANYREKGICSNSRTPLRKEIESRVLEGLREQMLTPLAISTYVKAYQDASAARKADLRSREVPLERRLGEVKRGIERLVDAIVEGTANDSMKARMQTLDTERQAIEATLQELLSEPQVPSLHPQAPLAYARMIERLQETLTEATSGDTRAQRELVAAVRGLIEKIVITPHSQERGSPIDVTLHGTLACFINQTEQPRNFGLGGLVAGGSYKRIPNRQGFRSPARAPRARQSIPAELRAAIWSNLQAGTYWQLLTRRRGRSDVSPRGRHGKPQRRSHTPIRPFPSRPVGRRHVRAAVGGHLALPGVRAEHGGRPTPGGQGQRAHDLVVESHRAVSPDRLRRPGRISGQGAGHDGL